MVVTLYQLCGAQLALRFFLCCGLWTRELVARKLVARIGSGLAMEPQIMDRPPPNKRHRMQRTLFIPIHY